MKVTEVPAQTGLADAAIDTLTDNTGLTVMATVLDVAGLPATQAAAVVRAHVKASLFSGT